MAQTDILLAYVAFAGVLTGFGFTSMVSYLTREEKTNAKDTSTSKSKLRAIAIDDVVATLFYSTISLGMSAFLYATLIGRSDNQSLVIAAMLPYGVAFGLSVVAFFYSLTLMMFERDIPKRAMQYAYWIVVSIGPAMVLSFLIGSARNSWQVRECPDQRNPCQIPFWFRWWFTVGFLVVVVVLSVMMAVLAQQRSKGTGVRLNLSRRPVLPCIMAVAFTFFIVIVIYPYLSARTDNYLPSSAFTYINFAIGFIFLEFFAFICGCVVGQRIEIGKRR
jgi:hypothetical protein